jgi:predicted phosphodiesterase
MTRLAVLSDIHGNLPALEAVWADMQAQGMVDACWVLGDLTAYFPWSAEVVTRLRALPNVRCLSGNLDRYVVSGYRPPVPVRSAEEWGRMPDLLQVREARFRWTVQRLSYDDCCWLRDLPAQLERDVSGYGRVVAVHAAPGDDEALILPGVPDGEIVPYLVDLDARLLLHGHTHIPIERQVCHIPRSAATSEQSTRSVRLVNPGSAGLPLDGDPRIAYALLDFAAGDCAVSVRRLGYDVEAMIREMEQLKYPAWEPLAQIARRGRR